MKQPDSIDTGTQMDIARYRLQIAREDLDTANLTFASEQYRAANNRAYYSRYILYCFKTNNVTADSDSRTAFSFSHRLSGKIAAV